MSYNGWSNYETWLADLWLMNDSEYLSELAVETAKTGGKDGLKELFEEEVLQIENHDGVVRDFLNSALDEVDFLEIVNSLIAD